MVWSVTYCGFLSGRFDITRMFATRERAEQWARQAGVYNRSHIAPCTGELHFYRCRAYNGRWPLLPVDGIHCGVFLNAQHYRELLKFWTGWSGGPDRMRYEYLPCDDQVEASEVLDHRGYMPHLARPEFATVN